MSTHYTQSSPFEPLEKIGCNGRIGLVALATDVNSETDLRRMAPHGVEIFTNRVQNCNPTTVENLRAMAPDITRAASNILPGDSLDVFMYACTSGTAVIGEHQVFQLLQAARNNLPCTTPLTAALAAFDCLSARRISILTPYIESVNRELVNVFTKRGIEVLNIHGFGLASDADMSGVSHACIMQAGIQACRAEADALFISCTALRAAEVIQHLESSLSKPVICSNQAMMWHALKVMQRPPEQRLSQITGFGQLFDY